MKNISTKAISVIMMLVFILTSLAACGKSGANTKAYSQGDGEYFSIELSEPITEILKKTVVKDGRVVSIHYYKLSGYVESYAYGAELKREIFNYDGDKLVSSETFLPVNGFEDVCNNGEMLEKLHETIYVYEGDRIVRGEVYANGLPTRSYDEYEYTEDGKLKTAKRYEHGELNRTYTYGDNGLPKTFEMGEFVYVFSYNLSGDLVKVREQNNNKYAYRYDLKYKNGRPIKIDYSQFVEPMTGEPSYNLESTVELEYAKNGEISSVSQQWNGKEGPKERWARSSLEYDENGRVVSVTSEADFIDKSTKVLTYNKFGALVHCEYFEESDGKSVSTGKYVAAEYDENGKCLKFVNYSGREYLYRYDENGRLVEKSYDSNVVGYEHEIVTYEYYPNGALKSVTTACDGEIRHEMEYYESSNLKTETQHYGKARSETYVDSPFNYTYSRVRSRLQVAYKHSVTYFDPSINLPKIQGELDIPQ